MNLNYKGLLQEYYQKQGLDFPVYTYVSTETNPKTWIASLQTEYGDYTSSSYGSKKEAGQIVAHMAYSSLFEKNSTQITTLSSSQTLSMKHFTLVVVDLENYPQINTPEFLNTQFINLQIKGFVGKCSSHAQIDLKSKYPFMETSIVNSVLPDAVDHYISMYIGQFIGQAASYLDYKSRSYNIIVLTRDRFVGCAMDAARQIEPELNINIVHAVTAQECYNYIIQFSN